MPRTPRKQRIETLAKKKTEIENQIKQLQSQEAQTNRQKDTRRKVLIGAAVLTMVEHGIEGWDERKLKAVMDKFLTRTSERVLFGLESQDPANTTANLPNKHSQTTSPTQAVEDDNSFIAQNTHDVQSVAQASQATPSQRNSRLAELDSSAEDNLEKEFNL